MNTVVVRTPAELRSVWAEFTKSNLPIGFDTETSGPSIVWKGKSRPDPYRAQLTGFSLAIGELRWYVPVRHVEGGNMPLLVARAFISNLMDLARGLLGPARRVWAHNWKYDLQILRNFGVVVDESDLLFDSLVAAWLAGWGADHKALKLKKLAVELALGDGDTFEDVAKKRQTDCIPVSEICEYAGRDAWLTATIGERAYERLREFDLTKHFHDMDMPLVEIIRGIEEWGTPVDPVRIDELRVLLAGEAAAISKEFEELTTTEVLLPVKERQPTGEFFKNGNPKMKSVDVLRPFTLGCKIGNDHQVSRWLYDELKLWPTTGLKKNGANHWPTDKATLEQWATLENPLAVKLASLRLEYVRRTKLISTYLDVMLGLPPQYADGLLHTSLNQTGTETQRFSSANPNLQNVPSRSKEGKLIRTALRARPGWVFIIFDYSQIELRIVAHLSQDEEMMACYILEEDIHAGTLAKMREYWEAAQRGDAKINNFSTIYRISPPSLAIKIKNTIEAAEKSIEAFYARFPRVVVYHRKAIAFAAKTGYTRTIDGFKRFLDTTPRRNRFGGMEMPWAEQNKSINTPVQGSAAGLAKKAMINVWRRWKKAGVYGQCVMLAGQEHDAIIAEARVEFAEQAFADLKWEMENAMKLRVPVIADGGTGPSWAEAKH